MLATGIKRIMLIVLGVVCVGLGLLGAVLPVLPTTPFLLLAAWAFIRSSPRLHSWLITHPVCGEYIYNYTTHRSVKRRSKQIAIVSIWLSMALSMYMVQKAHVTIMLIVIGVLVTAHILSLRTFESLPPEVQDAARLRCRSMRARHTEAEA